MVMILILCLEIAYSNITISQQPMIQLFKDDLYACPLCIILSVEREGRNFSDNIFKCVLQNENLSIII